MLRALVGAGGGSVRALKLVSVRVLSADVRAVGNVWCTDARFRNMSGRIRVKPRVLQCCHSAEDRIEHYVRCPGILTFAER